MLFIPLEAAGNHMSEGVRGGAEQLLGSKKAIGDGLLEASNAAPRGKRGLVATMGAP